MGMILSYCLFIKIFVLLHFYHAVSSLQDVEDKEDGNAFLMLQKGSPELSIIQQEFLSLLGVRRRPHLDLEKYRHNSAPHFLRQIYNSLDTLTVENAAEILKGEVDAEKLLSAVSNADLIISFINQGAHMQKSLSQFGTDNDSSSDHSDHEYLYFDIAGSTMEAEIDQSPTLAELRLYKEISPIFPPSGDHFTITLYKVVPVDNEFLGLELVAKKLVHPYFFGWIAFDVTEVLSLWQKDPFLNFGLQVVVRDFEDKIEYSLGSIAVSGNFAEDFKQPFMVAFYPTFDKKRTLRNTFNRNRRSPNLSYPTVMQNVDPYHRAQTTCQRKILYVSFADLGWDDWILGPNYYHAYHCSGFCPFPLDATLNATNHAILQALMSRLDPKNVPEACCGPKKLSSIQVLYFDDDSNVILKRYREMKVEYCGCH